MAFLPRRMKRNPSQYSGGRSCEDEVSRKTRGTSIMSFAAGMSTSLSVVRMPNTVNGVGSVEICTKTGMQNRIRDSEARTELALSQLISRPRLTHARAFGRAWLPTVAQCVHKSKVDSIIKVSFFRDRKIACAFIAYNAVHRMLDTLYA